MSAAKVLRYALFSGEHYYPLGGWDDFQGSYDSVDKAKNAHTSRDYSWAQVADLTTGEIVCHKDGLGAWKEGPYA